MTELLSRLRIILNRLFGFRTHDPRCYKAPPPSLAYMKVTTLIRKRQGNDIVDLTLWNLLKNTFHPKIPPHPPFSKGGNLKFPFVKGDLAGFF